MTNDLVEAVFLDIDLINNLTLIEYYYTGIRKIY